MAKKKYDREPVSWITINGNRVPVFEDGSLGSFMSGKEEGKIAASIDPVSKELVKPDVEIGEGKTMNDTIKYNAEEQAEAVNYMYGYDDMTKARQAIVDGKYTDDDIKRALLYKELEGLPQKYKKEAYERDLKKYGLEKKEDTGSFEAELEEYSDPEYKNVTKSVKTDKQLKVGNKEVGVSKDTRQMRIAVGYGSNGRKQYQKIHPDMVKIMGNDTISGNKLKVDYGKKLSTANDYIAGIRKIEKTQQRMDNLVDKDSIEYGTGYNELSQLYNNERVRLYNILRNEFGYTTDEIKKKKGR